MNNTNNANTNNMKASAKEAATTAVKPVEEEYHTYYFEMTDGLVMSAIGRNRTEAYLSLMGR